MTIKLSIGNYDNENVRLYALTDSNDRYVFIDEWREDKKASYPTLYTCTPEGLPYIPLYEEEYEIACGFNHVWDKSMVERLQNVHDVYQELVKYKPER